MAGFAALAWFEFRAYLKNVQTVFWTFAYPLLLVALLVAIFDAGNPGPHGPDSYRFFVVTGVLSITIVTNALYGFGSAWSEARGKSALIPYYTAPVHPLATCLAMMAARAAVLLVFAALFLPGCFAVLGVALPVSAASVGQLAAALASATGFGFVLTVPLVWLARRPTAVTAIVNVANLYMLMTADALFPVAVVPGWGTAFITSSPFYHLTQMLRAAAEPGQAGYVLASAAALAAAALALAALLARRRLLAPPG